MTKRLRLYSAHLERKDRISELPDDVLALILYSLNTNEVARTCVLSRRWENLWLQVATCLNFDGSKTIREIEAHEKSLKEGRKDYIRWVNEILDSRRVSNIDEFTVRFYFGRRDSLVVDKWVNFAMHRGVKRLEIDLTPFKGMKSPDIYTFPMDCYNFVRSSHGLSSIKFLKSLALTFVNVTEEIIMHFLFNSPLLERLSVRGAEHLLNLEVVGPSLQLNYFEIGECKSLKKIEISAPNLLSFSYSGKRISLTVGNLPLLAELSLDCWYDQAFEAIAFGSFSSFFSQLETLKLNMSKRLFMNRLWPQRFPQLTNLKHLLVKVTPTQKDNLLFMSWLLNSCPSLHKLSLDTTWTGRPPHKEGRIVKCSHKCLKVVEIAGFIGSETTVELALFFLKNAFILEKIILEHRRQTGCSNEGEESDESEGNDEDNLKEKRKRIKREGVKRLKRELPPGVDLIIL